MGSTYLMDKVSACVNKKVLEMDGGDDYTEL